MESMEQYYIATEDGRTEGPYLFESLETFYTDGKMTEDTLVCIVGSQEWVEFWTILEPEQKKEVHPCEKSKKQALERLMNEYDPIPKEQPKKELQKDIKPLEITVEGLFRIAGILALLAGVVLLFSTAKDRQPVLGFIYLLSGAFSCLGCFWCAKVIKLLSNTVELLTTISKRMYNIDKD